MRARFDFSADFGPRAQALASVDLSGTSVTIDMNSHGMEIDASLTSLLVRDVLRYQYVARFVLALLVLGVFPLLLTLCARCVYRLQSLWLVSPRQCRLDGAALRALPCPRVLPPHRFCPCRRRRVGRWHRGHAVTAAQAVEAWQ